MPRLTKRVVDAALADRPYMDHTIWDDELTGFGLRIRKSGSASYVAVYRIAGQKRWLTIGPPGAPWTPDQARKHAAAILLQAKTGADPQKQREIERKKGATVDELIAAYLEHGPADKPNKKPNSWAQDRSSLMRHVSPLIGKRSVESLTKADIATLQNDIALGKTSVDVKTRRHGRAIVKGGKATAARTVIILQATLAWGVQRGFLTNHPGKGVTRFKTDRRERYLSSEELDRLWRWLKKLCDLGVVSTSHATIFRLLALTGARKTEISELVWKEVDFERGLIFLSTARSKTGAKTIPLSAAAIELLLAWRKASPSQCLTPLDYVFPPLRKGAGPTVGLQKSWERLRRAAELEDIRIHDLRHTFASIAVANGASLFIVGKVLGHTQARTTERYAHLNASPARQLADQVAGQLGNWAEQDKAKD